MLKRTLGLGALLRAAGRRDSLMAGASVRAGENEDWCFADQEKTQEEASPAARR